MSALTAALEGRFAWIRPGISRVTFTYAENRVTIAETVDTPADRQTVHTFRLFGDPDRGELASVRDARNQLWTYSYNGLGKLTNVQTPDGLSRSWTYERVGSGPTLTDSDRARTERHPESGLTTYQYDAAGSVSEKVDANGRSFTYRYDGNGRLSRIDVDEEIATTVSYEPGTDDRKQVTHGGVTTTYTYDPNTGRLVRSVVTVGGTPFPLGLEYNGNDEITAITYPAGRRCEYDYDAEGRIRTVVDRTAGIQRPYATNVQYHPSGVVASYIAGNGITHTTTYNQHRYWPETIAAAPVSLGYENDGVGNVRRLVDGRSGYTQFFNYDALDRLERAEGPYGVAEYRYDAHGNRATWADAFYEYYPATLRLREQRVGGITRSFTYDLNGNVTSEPNRTYTYTPFNMIESVTGDGASEFRYDGDQWRVSKTVGPNRAIYVRGPGNEVLTEWTNPGSATETIRDYIYAGSRLIAVVKQDRAVTAQ